MTARLSLIDQKRLQIRDADRKIAQVNAIITEFEQLSATLAYEIKVEEDRSGVHDPAHFAYSTYATTARQRRENIHRSVMEFRKKLEMLKIARLDATETLESLYRLTDSKIQKTSGALRGATVALGESAPSTAG